MRVLVPLANGVEEIEAVTIIDVLRRSGLDVVGAAIGGSLTIQGSRGITLLADALWSSINPADFDALALPGGGKGTEALNADARIIQTVKAFNAAGKVIAALCAAPTVLATAGVLANRRATCYPTCINQLGESYDEAPVIADGHIITGQGPGLSMLFALVLVQHLVGDEPAHRVAAGLLTSL